MAEILLHPNPLLRCPATPVLDFDGALMRLIATMREVLDRTPHGLALAANQIGRRAAVFYIHPRVLDQVDVQRAHLHGVPEVFVNPRVVPLLDDAELHEAPEGCLSFPGAAPQIRAASNVRVQAYNEHGESFTFEAKGLVARVIQHEAAHLRGRLIIDRTNARDRHELRRRFGG